MKIIKDTSPCWSSKHVSMSFLASNVARWYELLSVRYYEDIGALRDVKVDWTDTFTKEGSTLLETIISLSGLILNCSTTTNVPDNSLNTAVDRLGEIIAEEPPYTINVTITVFHSTGNIMIQGTNVDKWAEHEYAMLKPIYLSSKDVITEYNEIFGTSLTHTTDVEKEISQVLEEIVSSVIGQDRDIMMDDHDKNSVNIQDGSAQHTNGTIPSTPVHRIKISQNIPESTHKSSKKAKSDAKREDDLWRRNVEGTVSKLDADMVDFENAMLANIQSKIIEAVTPLLKENTDLKHQIAELMDEAGNLKSKINDVEVQCSNKMKLLEKQTKSTAQQLNDEQGKIKSVMGKLDKSLMDHFQKSKALESKVNSLEMDQAIIKQSHESLISETEVLNASIAKLQGQTVDTPQKITKPKVINLNEVEIDQWIIEEGHTYIGRKNTSLNLEKSPFQNPFHLNDFNNCREMCLAEYEKYLRGSPQLMERLSRGELDGKILGCFCAPAKCHGDILLKICNELKSKPTENSGLQKSEHHQHAPHKSLSEKQQPEQLSQLHQPHHQQNAFRVPYNSNNRTYAAVSKSYQSHRQQLNQHQLPPQQFDQHQPPVPSTYNQISQDQRPHHYHKSSWQNNIQTSGPHNQQQNPPSRPNKNIVVVMDSNRRHINFHKLFEEVGVVRVIPCGSVSIAEEKLLGPQKPHLDEVTDIILHIGVNDVDGMSPDQLSNRLMELSSNVSANYKCRVHISQITPRGDNFGSNVVQTNNLIKEKVGKSSSSIGFIPHISLSWKDLHDDRHLHRQGVNGKLSPVLVLAGGFYEALEGRNMDINLLKQARRYSPPRRSAQHGHNFSKDDEY